MNPLQIVAKDVKELQEKLNAPALNKNRSTLAIVFAGENHDFSIILDSFAQKQIDVFGCTSGAGISNSSLLEDAIIVMLLSFDRKDYRMATFETDEDFKLGTEMMNWSRDTYEYPAMLTLIAGAGLTINGDLLMKGIKSVPMDTIPLFGGYASADNNIVNTACFSYSSVKGQTQIKKGALCLCFDNRKIDLKGMAISGWKEIGTPKLVTKAEGNIVHEIDGMPATDFYWHYFRVRGEVKDQFMVNEYPLMIMREDGSTAMRAAVNMDLESKSVVYAGSVPQGAKIRFTSPNIVETIEYTIEGLHRFQENEQLDDVKAIILFDCAIRLNSFGTYFKRELQCIHELWNVPMSGFCSFGEIGNYYLKPCDFHNTTLSMVMIREKGLKSKLKKKFGLNRKKMASIIETEEDVETVENLKSQVERLRKEKTMLSNFLHLTSDDLDKALEDIKIEQQKAENLLLNILPKSIAERLKEGESTIADNFANVSVLFADLVGFTNLASRVSAAKLVELLNSLFSKFDSATQKMGIEKIKTIGDAYMAVAGLPEEREDHAQAILNLANYMLDSVASFNKESGEAIDIRIGINSGPVVAGIIGTKKFIYDLWGDAVNIASRMESHGIPGKIHLSESSYLLLKDQHRFEARGEIEIKGKGMMNTYLYLP